METLTRLEWGAAPTRSSSTDPAPEPFEVLELHHTGVIAHYLMALAAVLRSVQRFHLARGWFDIFYHFLIDRHGRIGEGRSTAWSHGRQLDALVVCFPGNYDEADPTPDQKAALAELAAHLVASGVLAETFVTRAHSDRAATACPGSKWQAWLETRSPGWWKMAVPVTAETVLPRWTEPWGYANTGEPFVDRLIYPSGVLLLAADGALYGLGKAEHHGAPNGTDYWGDRQASRIHHANPTEARRGRKYTIVSSEGDEYGYPEGT